MHKKLRISELLTSLLGDSVYRTVPPCYRTVVCLSVCLSLSNVGVLWPNGWMDQNATWIGDRPRPRPHCVRWRPSSPLPPKGTQPPIFGLCLLLPNVRRHIMMPLGTEVGLGTGHIVSDGDPAPPTGAQDVTW